jgi:hypothetical protein
MPRSTSCSRRSSGHGWRRSDRRRRAADPAFRIAGRPETCGEVRDEEVHHRSHRDHRRRGGDRRVLPPPHGKRHAAGGHGSDQPGRRGAAGECHGHTRGESDGAGGYAGLRPHRGAPRRLQRDRAQGTAARAARPVAARDGSRPGASEPPGEPGRGRPARGCGRRRQAAGQPHGRAGRPVPRPRSRPRGSRSYASRSTPIRVGRSQEPCRN